MKAATVCHRSPRAIRIRRDLSLRILLTYLRVEAMFPAALPTLLLKYSKSILIFMRISRVLRNQVDDGGRRVAPGYTTVIIHGTSANLTSI